MSILLDLADTKIAGLEQACKELAAEANRNDIVIAAQKKRIEELLEFRKSNEVEIHELILEKKDLKTRLELALHQRDSSKQLAEHIQGLAWDFHVPYPAMKLTEVRTDKVQYFIDNHECSKQVYESYNQQMKALHGELDGLRRELRDLKVLSGVAKGTLMGQVLKLSAEIENLQTRIGDLEVLSSDHQKLNGALRAEVSANETAIKGQADTIKNLYSTLTRAQEEGTKLTLANRSLREGLREIEGWSRTRITIMPPSLKRIFNRLRGL